MAAIGMKYPTFAVFPTSYTEGTEPTYTGGKVFAHAIAGTLTENRRDNPLYGDDTKIENDKGITDYTLSVEVDHLDIADRVALLGEVAISAGSTSPSVVEYAVQDTNPGYVGFGYMRGLMVGGTRKYEAYWFYKCQFTEPSIQANTKKEQTEWGTTTLEGTGFGIQLDNTGAITHYAHMEFADEADALDWIKDKAGITA